MKLNFYKHKNMILDTIKAYDTIHIILKKIAIEYDIKNFYQLYLWYKRPILNKELEIIIFINNCFLKNRKLPSELLSKYIKYYFDVDHTFIYPIIDRSYAIQLIKDLKLTHVIEPLMFKYEKLIKYNPLENPSISDSNILNLNLLESIIPGDVDEIFIIHNDDLPVNIYFPFKDTPINSKDVNSYITTLNKIEQDLTKAYVNMKNYKLNEYTTYISFNVFCYNNIIDLGILFEEFILTEQIFFMKYKTYNNIFYKFHKKSLVKFNQEEIDKLKTFKNKQDTQFIVFKTDQFTLLITETFDISLKFKTSRNSKFIIKKINLDIIKTILDFARNIYYDIYIPQKISFEDITELNTYIVFNKQIPNIQSIITNRLFPYFNIINTQNHILSIQYKRIDNFSTYSDIKSFIRANYSLEKSELVQKIMNIYNITEEEAIEEYDTFGDAADIIKEKFVRTSYNSFVNIKINLKTNEVFIYGARNLQMLSSIVYILKCLYSNSLPHTAIHADTTKALFEIASSPKSSASTSVSASASASSVNLDELDPDFLELLEETKTPADIPNTSKKESPIEKPIKRSSSIILDRLKTADRDLFIYKRDKDAKRQDYATVCTGRQPIVISKKEKEIIDRDHRDSYSESLQIGSTAKLAEQNYYICPAIWCPASKVSLSYKEYTEKGCPGEGEEPIKVHTNKNYWKKEEDATKRYPSVLDPYIHPKGFCLPCCFKLENKTDNNRNRQRLETCKQIRPDLILENFKTDKSSSIKSNPNYVLAEDKIPLDIGRFGLLPTNLHNLMDNKCTTGNLPNECYLRKGIDNSQGEFFLSAIAFLLNFKNVEALKKNILSDLSISKFMSLENSKICRLFMTNNTKTTHAEFTKFFLEQTEYIKKFNLIKVRNNIEDPKNPEVLREYLIYNSFKNYKKYITESIVDYRTIWDLININYDINICIIENNYILCPFNRNAKTIIDIHQPFVFLISNGKYFEPMCYVKDSISKTKFTYKDSSEYIRKLISYYYNSCNSFQNTEDSKTINLLLKNNYIPKYYVIDYTFNICGVLIKENLYIPLDVKIHIYNVYNKKFVYISDIPRFKTALTINEIKTIYKKLGIKILKIYATHLELESNIIVPISTKYKITQDLDILIGSPERSSDMIETIEADIYKYLAKNPDIRKEIEFLKLKDNPFSLDYRRQKLLNIFEKFDISEQFIETILVGIAPFKRKTSDFFTNLKDTEIILEHMQLMNNELENLVNFYDNPYKLLNQKLISIIGHHVTTETDLIDTENIFKDFIIDSRADVFIKFKNSLGAAGFQHLDHFNETVAIGASLIGICCSLGLFIRIREYL